LCFCANLWISLDRTSTFIKVCDTLIFYDVISMFIELCCRADPCRKPQFTVINSLSLFAPLPQSLGFPCPLPSLVLTFPKLCVKICDASIKLLPPLGWCAFARGEDRHYFLLPLLRMFSPSSCSAFQWAVCGKFEILCLMQPTI
jgi:hypothetical protein